jgi:hypothetical protein
MNGVDPATLFRPERLDLCVKYLYARALLANSRVDLFERLYIRHILHRTGGREPNDLFGVRPAKDTIENYLDQYKTLIASLQHNGFDESQPVYLMRNGLVGNGAHRIAAAHALGLKLATQDLFGDGATWDFDWFRSRGYADADLQRILACWVGVNAATAVMLVLWSPVERAWPDLQARCRQSHVQVGEIDIAFAAEQRPAFESLVLDLYCLENSDQANGLANIERKCDILAAFPPRLKVLVLSPRPGASAETPEQLKSALRQLAAGLSPVDRFTTCHAAQSARELRQMAHVLLTPEYLAATELRAARLPRRAFLASINAYQACLRYEGISAEDCCVVGSSTMEVLGIRDATDVDFTTKDSIRSARYSSASAKLADGVDIVTKGYHRTPRRNAVTDDALIGDEDRHFRFRGCKFAGIDIVRDRKGFSRRPKDVVDIALMDDWLMRHRSARWFNGNIVVYFHVGGNLEQYAISGWGASETWGTWVAGREASLLLPTPRMGIAGVLLHARIKYRPEIMRDFVLHVAVDGHGVAACALDAAASQAGFATIEATIPGDLLAGSARYRMDFRALPRPPRPEPAAAADGETPGFGLCLARAYCLPSAAT